MVDAKIIAMAHLKKIGSTSTLSASAQKLVRVFAKKGKGTLDMNAVIEVMEAIDPRWDFKEKVGTQTLDRERIGKILQKRFGLEIIFPTDLKEEEALVIEEANRPDMHLGVGEPSNPRTGHVYTEKWKKIEAKPFVWKYLFGAVWYGAPIWEITAPSGKKVQITMGLDSYGTDISPSGFKSAALWKLLYAEGAHEGAMAILTEAPTIGISPSQVRDLTNTGTCPVCSNNHKLRADKMVDHGYVIPRYSRMRQRSCFGVGHPPYELSAKGCVEYRKDLIQVLEQAHQDLKALQQDEKEIFDRHNKPVPREHRSYDPLRRQTMAKVQSDIKYLTEDIKTMDARIKAWKLSPLPGDI